jgi:hypothetical protein
MQHLPLLIAAGARRPSYCSAPEPWQCSFTVLAESLLKSRRRCRCPLMIALSEYAARACHSAAGLIFWIDVN